MKHLLACITDDAPRIRPEDRKHILPLGPQETPFGPCGPLFRITPDQAPPCLLLSRSPGEDTPLPADPRANLFALKDQGATAILGWESGMAITHNFAVAPLTTLHMNEARRTTTKGYATTDTV